MQKVNLYSSSLNDLLCNGIVRKYQFKSPGRYHYDKLDAYLVDSEIPGLHYIVDNDRMAMVRHDDLALWDIDDTPTEAKKFIGRVKKEILDIYADIKSLRSMTVKYEEVKLNT